MPLSKKPPSPKQLLQISLQEKLAAASTLISECEKIADELQESFEFLESTYHPQVSITKTTGGWNYLREDHWDSSNC